MIQLLNGSRNILKYSLQTVDISDMVVTLDYPHHTSTTVNLRDRDYMRNFENGSLNITLPVSCKSIEN